MCVMFLLVSFNEKHWTEGLLWRYLYWEEETDDKKMNNPSAKNYEITKI